MGDSRKWSTARRDESETALTFKEESQLWALPPKEDSQSGEGVGNSSLCLSYSGIVQRGENIGGGGRCRTRVRMC